MNSGIDFQAAAKALVPNEFRPVSDKESWGQSLLTSKQFLGLTSVTMLAFVSGFFLYYSFYVTFILSSVESSVTTPKPPRSPIAGSYRRIMRHLLSSYGWHHFITGAFTFVWTALFAYIGRWALNSWVLSRWTTLATSNDSSMPTNSSIYTLIGGSDLVSGFLLESLSIVFTHKILTSSNFSALATLKRIVRSQQLYICLIYIGTIRTITSAAQSALMVTDSTEHYARPFMTFMTYILLFLIRTVLITRSHASLLPPATPTTVDINTSTQVETTAFIWQWFLRTVKMFKLLITCTILASLHVIITLAGLMYASGQSQKVIDWAYSAKSRVTQATPSRNPGFMMGYDPELDPHHFH
ncbi:hypothetical protein M408DRAFT_331322 [Serendipita vermifera MAFF 305830]|uniref:Uncharacterized protein n=1 Tax=Serendipita vermifera MAFF 305830 TaxID=933852 RepID=A0A0C2WFN2_SERVB|nr:hypothetical protein M408DRAFT_331322 [Serendipita vermifera MAFF 305830]